MAKRPLSLQIQVRVDDECHARITEMAEQHGLAVSDIMRRALSDYLRRKAKAQPAAAA